MSVINRFPTPGFCLVITTGRTGGVSNDHYRIVCEPATAGAGGALIATIRLRGEFDLSCSDQLRTAILTVITTGQCTRVVVDLAAVGFLDSSTVQVLLDGHRAAQQHGLHYQLINVTGLPRRVLDVMGLSAVLVADDPDHLMLP